MKTLTVTEAQGQLAELIAQVNRGEHVVLKNGDQEATLCAGRMLDIDQDSPELEAELLKGIDSPLSPYSSQEMREIGEEIIRQARKA